MKPVVLLVEDEEDDVFFMKRALAKASVTVDVRVAEDGQEALRYLRGEGTYADRQAHPSPQLTFLDVNLPHLSGLEVLRQIRADPELKKLVVVMLTSSSANQDVDLAYELGASSYLIKPNQPEGLEVVIEHALVYWLNHNVVTAAM